MELLVRLRHDSNSPALAFEIVRLEVIVRRGKPETKRDFLESLARRIAPRWKLESSFFVLNCHSNLLSKLSSLEDCLRYLDDSVSDNAHYFVLC